MNFRERLLFLWNFWPPFFFTGIKIQTISKDFRHIEVRLKLHWWNANYVGTQYGGSLFSMTDPFYMLILLKNLGKDYIVWDKSASIKFIKPGKSTAKAVFMVNEPILQEIREQVEQNGKTTKVFSVPIHDANGELIALVEKNLYIRKKESKNKIDSSVDTLNNNYNNKTN